MQEYMIKVQRGKYIVVLRKGEDETPARNWKHLSDEAKRAVFAQSGNALHAGLYPCPEALARQAK